MYGGGCVALGVVWKWHCPEAAVWAGATEDPGGDTDGRGLAPCAAPSDRISASGLRSPSLQHGRLCCLLRDLLNVLEKNKGPIVRVLAKQQTSGFSGPCKFRSEISKRQVQSIGISEVVRNALSSALHSSARLVEGSTDAGGVLSQPCRLMGKCHGRARSS